jgi:hypothetical protein
MLGREGIDEVVVTTVDSAHDHCIVAALEAGCRVVTEKPMTVDGECCAHILEAVRGTGNSLTVAFNYRFDPVHETVRALLAEGAVGQRSPRERSGSSRPCTSGGCSTRSSARWTAHRHRPAPPRPNATARWPWRWAWPPTAVS